LFKWDVARDVAVVTEKDPCVSPALNHEVLISFLAFVCTTGTNHTGVTVHMERRNIGFDCSHFLLSDLFAFGDRNRKLPGVDNPPLLIGLM
jgi:hypothetical protein